MVTEQFPIETMTVWPPAVRLDGREPLQAGLAVAWSASAGGVGRADDRLAATRAAASAVARVSGCAESAVALSHRAGAAPVPMRLHEGAAEPLDCAVSIAHSSGHAVAAAAAAGAARRLGVDLERTGTVSPTQLRLFASRAERALGVDPTTLWTLKEAAWKAFSCDATTPFHALTVAALEAAPAPMYVVFGLRDDIVPGFACIWHPWPGWLAALVAVT
jgi:phosphopantetheinyl transferase (holo-ACP synthase)